ncbi:hypothetical protein MKX03_019237 [Papaver bracteatum]|nr:hypothetical protein MKX03_019237 [Papaver bracteatum]
MAVPKPPLSLIAFFFLFTFVASQSKNAGVLESMRALGEKACVMALDNLGPGSSCDDRLRNGKVLYDRGVFNFGRLSNFPDPSLHQDLLNVDQKQIPKDPEDLAVSKLKNVKDRIEFYFFLIKLVLFRLLLGRISGMRWVR